MTDNPYITPQTSPVSLAQEDELIPVELASRWARLGASLLDSIVLLAVFIPILFVVFAAEVIPGLPDSGNFLTNLDLSDQTLMGNILTTIMSILVYLAVNGYLLVKYGQSVGKKILGIKIVDFDTHKLLPASRVLGVRYILMVFIAQIPFAGSFFTLVDALFIFNTDKRCLHDLIANSSVIKL